MHTQAGGACCSLVCTAVHLQSSSLVASARVLALLGQAWQVASVVRRSRPCLQRQFAVVMWRTLFGSLHLQSPKTRAPVWAVVSAGHETYSRMSTSKYLLTDALQVHVATPVLNPHPGWGGQCWLHAETTTHLSGAGTELVNTGRVKIHFHTPNEGSVGTARPVASIRTAGRWRWT